MTQITWGGTSGDWATGTDWIGNKAPTSSEDALLSGTGTYTVTVTTADVAQSVSVDDADATLAIDSGGTLTLGAALTVAAGTVEVNNGGTISGGVLSATGGDFMWSGGTLDGVTYEGTLNLTASSASLSISSNGLIAKGTGGAGNGAIDITGAGAALYLDGTQTLDKATVDLGNAGSYDYFYEEDLTTKGAVLTLGAGLTIDHTGTYANIDGSGSTGDAIINKGVIDAALGGGHLIIDPLAFTNDGTITVANGDTVAVEPTTFSNAGGAITVDGASTVVLDCDLTTAELGSLTNAGTVEIDQTLTNTGATLKVGTGSALGALTLENGGVISGGTISDAGSGIVGAGGTLNGVTYEGTLNLTASSSSLSIGDEGLIAEGTGGVGNGAIDITGAGAALYLDGTQTLDKATVDLGNAGSYDYFYEEDATDEGAVLTLGAGLTIDHTGTYANIDGSGSTGDAIINKGVIDATLGGGHLIIDPLAFTNDGTITVANGDTVAVEPTTFSNAGGAITVDGASTVVLDCDLTTAELGSLTNAGTVEIDQTLTNTGATLKVGTGSALGALTLENGGVISGGTISDAGSGIVGAGGTLNGVTYEGTLNLTASSSSLSIGDEGLIAEGTGGVGNGAIDITGAGAALYLDGTQTLDKATVDLGNAGSYDYFYEEDATDEGAVLTLGAGLTIDHTGTYANIDGSGSTGDAIINKGVIDATLGGGHLIIDPLAFTNDGTITVANGDTVAVEPTTFSNAGGAITVDGASTVVLDCDLTTAELGSLTNAGTVEIDQTLTNTGATLKVGTGSALGALTLENGGVISGGTISDAGSGIVGAGGTLNGVTYEGTLNLTASSSSLSIGDEGLIAEGTGGVGNGAIDITGAGAALYLDGTQTLDKATVDLGNAGSYDYFYEEDATDEGAVLTLGAGLTIDHTGTYANIDGSGSTGDKVINEGVINATLDGGHLNIDPLAFTNDGTITVADGDTVDVDSSPFNDSAGILTVGSGSALDLENGTVLLIQSTLSNAGTIGLQSGGDDTEIRVLAGGLTLDGDGRVALSGSKAVITGVSSAAVLTNVNETISGEGFVGLGALTVHNEAAGVIDASASGQLSVNTHGKTLINAGLIESTVAGAFLILNATSIANAGGTISAAGGVVDLQDADVIGGTLAGTRVLNVNTGASALDGTTAGAVDLAATVQVLSGTTLSVDGTISGSGSVDLYGSGKLVVGTAGVTLTGGIHVGDNDIITSTIAGAAASATLTNVDGHFDCVGQLGDGSMVLDNEAAGVILDAQSKSLTINTGAKTITNAGTIASSGTGGVVVASAVANTGILQAGMGTMTLSGVVTGAGTGKITGGTLDATATADFEEDVTFVGGSTGTLELGASQAYAGTVTGFSTSGATALDLADIHFASGTTTASYVGTAAGGVLTVTSGAEVAKIHLAGNYLSSKWTLSTDGHGGTTVVDPAGGGAIAVATRAPRTMAFVEGMAALGSAATEPGPGPEVWRSPSSALTAPKTQAA